MRAVQSYIIAILLIAVPLSAIASDQNIVISGSRGNTPSSVDIITISDSDRQVKTLSEILESRAGIQFMRYGSSGSYSSIYVRGTNSNQLAVYIDGIPLSDSVFGEVNFENIPIDSIERIEIYKSFTPLCFGAPGIGGVINLVTKKNRRTTETGAAISAGSFDAYRLSVFHSYTEDPTSLFVTGSASSSKGNFPFRNNNGTPLNLTDDFNDTRKNNGFESGNATVRYSRNAGDITIDALSDFFAKDQGVPSYNNTATSASLNTIRSLNNARVTFSKMGGLPLSEQLSIFANVRRDTFNDLADEIGLFAQKTTGTYFTYGAGSCTTFTMKDLFQELSLSVQGQNEFYYLTHETNNGSQGYPAQKRNSLMTGVQDTLSFFDARIIFIPLVRLDERHDSFNGVTSADRSVYSCDPQIGTILWILKDLLYIKGSYGLNHRAPSFSELFGNSGTVQGNADLADEKSENLDATIGIIHSDFSSEYFQSFSIEYSFFYTRIKNIIIYIQNTPNTMKAENISAASITGHEVTAHATLLDHFDLSGNATLQYAMDGSNISYYTGNFLPNRPILECNAAVKIFGKFGSIIYQYCYEGGNYRDSANSPALYIKQRIYHTITAVWTPRYDLTITLEARNITNNQTQDVAGYPLPGRSFTGSMQYIF